MKRKAISKRVRFEIFARDNFTCRYCGTQSDKTVLVVDHVQPVCQGGTNDTENLITSCEPCNQGKGGKTIEQSAPTEADRLRLAQERNEQIGALESVRNAIKARDEIRQLVLEFWCEQTGGDSMDRGTLTTMVHYVDQFGIEIIMGWIEKAVARVGRYNDRKIGMYVSGIRRKHLEEIEEGEEF